MNDEFCAIFNFVCNCFYASRQNLNVAFMAWRKVVIVWISAETLGVISYLFNRSISGSWVT